MIPEARLEDAGNGLVPKGEGWYVLNARESWWLHAPGRSAICVFEGDAGFEQLGFNIGVLAPGQIMAMYHWEADQEDFLVLSGEAMLVVEGRERPLRAWDFFHCPAGTEHVIVGAGDASCIVVAVGARDRSVTPEWGSYVANETARKYGASPEADTTDLAVAYAGLVERSPTRYDGWLPE